MNKKTAKKILSHGNWTPLSITPPLKSLPTERSFGDTFAAKLDLDEIRISDRVNFLIPIFADDEDSRAEAESVASAYADAIAVAKSAVIDDKKNWEKHEGGGVFESDQERRRWHELRAAAEATNKFLAGLKTEISK